jgi:hypothetical protein
MACSCRAHSQRPPAKAPKPAAGVPVPPVQAKHASELPDADTQLARAERLGHRYGQVPLAGQGRPLPEPTRRQMEAAFGEDLSHVRVHEGGQAESLDAVAYTQGHHIHFAPGRYSPRTREGQRLLGHELAHVVQQRAGRVALPQGAGAPINGDPHLEAEADKMALGALAARPAPEPAAAAGAPATSGGPAPAGPAASGGAMQRMPKVHHDPTKKKHLAKAVGRQQVAVSQAQRQLINAGVSRKEAKRQARQQVRQQR